MSRILCFLMMSLFMVRLAAQDTRVDSIQIFYNVNESEPAMGYSRIDSLISQLKNTTGKLKITGYADFLHDAAYNVRLSQKRADGIKTYVLSKLPNAQISACRGVGEKYSKENGSKEGEPFQRRVSIVYEHPVQPVAKESTQIPVKEEKVKEEPKKENRIEQLDKGQSLALQGLNFEPGRHFIMKSSAPVLQKLLTTMQENPKLKIQIQGHVCCTYGQDDGLDYDTHERKLSENRAKAIYDYLISKGISSKRLSYKGFGHSKPLYPAEATPDEEQANRRVEIMVIEK